MTRRLISSGSPFEAEIGYSRAVVEQGVIFVSGTTGFNYQAMTIADNAADQCEQAMRNIAEALSQAGAGIQDLVRVTYIVPERAAFEACVPVLRRWLGEIRPAATMLIAGLLDPRVLIEIEATALQPQS